MGRGGGLRALLRVAAAGGRGRGRTPTGRRRHEDWHRQFRRRRGAEGRSHRRSEPESMEVRSDRTSAARHGTRAFLANGVRVPRRVVRAGAAAREFHLPGQRADLGADRRHPRPRAEHHRRTRRAAQPRVRRLHRGRGLRLRAAQTCTSVWASGPRCPPPAWSPRGSGWRSASRSCACAAITWPSSRSASARSCGSCSKTGAR